MKTTYDGLFSYSAEATAWLEQDDNSKTKLGYAIRRVNEQVQKAIKKYHRKIQDLRCDYAMTSQEGRDKGAILQEERDGQAFFKFSPENLKKLNEAIAKLDESEVEIKPYYATELPGDLDEYLRFVFSGIVIREEAVGAHQGQPEEESCA